MKSAKLEGVIIAMPTPLLENEDIDTRSLCRLIDFCIGEGVHGIMLAGTMGEGPAIIDEQKRLLLEVAVAHTAKRVPLLATVSAPSTRKSLEEIKTTNALGVDYVVCMSPFYYRYPDPKSLLLHLSKIADHTAAPVIFYNAPGFTGNQVDVNTMEKILNMERVAGIKDSSGNYRDFVELLRRYPDRNSRPGTIMQGDESVLDASLLMGADGLVSGGGIAYIKLLLELYQAGSSNNRSKAIECQRRFSQQLSSLLLPNPQRDWMFNIKNKLVNMDIIRNGYVTTPFMNSAETNGAPL